MSRITLPTVLLLLLPATGLTENQSNAVNERLPVTRAELEAHWQVDCQANWAAIKNRRSSADCPPDAELLQALQLCAFIYQPPGEEPAAVCPDYRGLLQHLKTSPAPGNCDPLAHWLSQQPTCRDSTPTK